MATKIKTTHVGSLPRVGDLTDRLYALDRGTLSEADRAAMPAQVREAVATTVARQVEIGIDIPSDGEQGKYGYATYVKQRLTGLDGENVPLSLSEFADYPDFRMKVALEVTNPACVGPIGYAGEKAVQVDIDNALAAAKDAGANEIFLNAASPGIIADYQVNQYYASDEEYLYALADAMKTEYDLITRAGITLQLDCPDLALGRHLAPQPLSIEAFRRQIELRVEIINHATRDIDPGLLRIHLCWGNYESPHHHDVPLADIVDIVLRARARTVLFEAANPRHEHEWTVFTETTLPDDKIIVPGVIDTLTSYIEHPELAAQRLGRYVDAVGPERVMAGTDCGMATFADFVHVHPEIAWAKLTSMVEGAAIASQRAA
jgi:5-methyltetrahydropteroyltriglutamate--homocysteine methyltransferase